MKRRKFLGFWLLITLVMALGIGAVGAITISRNSNSPSQNDSAVQEEATSESASSNAEAGESGKAANPKGYLSNQRKHDIDLDVLGAVMGEYQSASADEAFWHLSILEDHGDDGPYLSITNKDSGKIGFEGKIMYLKKNPDKEQVGNLVIVEVDKDNYDKMPADWKLESDGKYAILNIYTADGGVKLGYRGSEMQFDKDAN